MRNRSAIVDAGPIFSLAVIDKLQILDQVFNQVTIPRAVWKEITLDKTTTFYNLIETYFKTKIVDIKGFNELTFVMDYGESESVILYKELNADFLLIDDKKARNIAENFNVRCVGTLGVLSKAKEAGMIEHLRPIFMSLIKKDRYFSLRLLNTLLDKYHEQKI